MRALLVLALGGFLSGSAPAQAPTSKLQREYEQEHDPVRKAKLLAKLGSVEIERAAALLKDGDERQALSGLQYYRDQVRSTSDALTATGVDPGKRPAGFKELQIALREDIRRLDDLIFSLPVDDRGGFEEVRAGLAAAQSMLFGELFPTAAEGAKKKR